MEIKELREVLEQHHLYLDGEGGSMADLGWDGLVDKIIFGCGCCGAWVSSWADWAVAPAE